jgi:hypothetical protein
LKPGHFVEMREWPVRRRVLKAVMRKPRVQSIKPFFDTTAEHVPL